MTFKVIDNKTGHYPDTYRIARREKWAKHLIYCDIDGFAMQEDGTLLLLDDIGNVAVCPEGRFTVILNNAVVYRIPDEGAKTEDNKKGE